MTTVTVGCKLPNGMSINVGATSVMLKGANSSSVIGGHGMTENVDADFFAAWLKTNAEREVVKNGFVFANGNAKKTADEAKEKAGEVTKLEPLNPNDPKNGVKTASKV